MGKFTTQITVSCEGPATPKELAEHLRMQAGLLEGMEPKKASSVKNTSVDDDDDEEELLPKKGKKTIIEDDEDEEDEILNVEEDDDDDEEEAPVPKKKASKKKGPTLNDVQDACKKASRKLTREKVLKVLKKKFGVASVSELEPDQYADVIETFSA